MPFDPKLIHQAEAPLNEAGDLQLPDDLLELAAQLGDDAQHLAKVYPASSHLAPRDESITTTGSSTCGDAFPLAEREGHYASTSQSIGLLSATQVGQASSLPVKETDLPRQAGSLPHLRRTSRRLLRALALVASLAAVIVGATLWYPREDNDPQPRSIAASPESAATETRPVSSVSPTPASPPAPAPAPPAPATRDTFLHEYSGPELEGIYDLIGDSEDDKISI